LRSIGTAEEKVASISPFTHTSRNGNNAAICGEIQQQASFG
jgi:hypothetical protein